MFVTHDSVSLHDLWTGGTSRSSTFDVPSWVSNSGGSRYGIQCGVMTGNGMFNTCFTDFLLDIRMVEITE